VLPDVTRVQPNEAEAFWVCLLFIDS